MYDNLLVGHQDKHTTSLRNKHSHVTSTYIFVTTSLACSYPSNQYMNMLLYPLEVITLFTICLDYLLNYSIKQNRYCLHLNLLKCTTLVVQNFITVCLSLAIAIYQWSWRKFVRKIHACVPCMLQCCIILFCYLHVQHVRALAYIQVAYIIANFKLSALVKWGVDNWNTYPIKLQV